MAYDPAELNLLVGRRIRAARQERGLSLAQLGGNDLSRSFLSLVERGKSRISLRALAVVAARLELPVSYFVATVPDSPQGPSGAVADRATAALAYSAALQQRGDTAGALRFALRAAELALEYGPPSSPT